MKRITLLVTVIALAVVACSSDSGELDVANARIAELEAELFTATSVPGASEATEGAETVIGVVAIPMSATLFQSAAPGTECAGVSGGYGDIRGGAQVVVLDGAGSTIGVSSLRAGEATDTDPQKCALPFEVEVPSDADFYEITISDRGGPTYSNDDMVAESWTVVLSLG